MGQTDLCMRTTLNLDDELAVAAKKRAAEEQTTLTRILEDALREYLRPKEPEVAYELTLPARSMGLRPGIDPDDRDSLYEAMDGSR